MYPNFFVEIHQMVPEKIVKENKHVCVEKLQC